MAEATIERPRAAPSEECATSPARVAKELPFERPRRPGLQEDADGPTPRAKRSARERRAGRGRLRQLDCLIKRPAADWIGRAFIGYSLAKMLICDCEIVTGCCITIHSTPSLQGGVVSEPM